MAHFEYVQENVDPSSIFNVIEDESCISMQCVEDIPRCVSKVYKQLLHTPRLLLQAHEIDVGVFTRQGPVRCTWAVKPNR